MPTAKNSKTSSSIEDLKEHSTALVAYDEVVLMGQVVNAMIRKESFALSTRWMLILNSYVWQRAAEFSIKKLILLWCPCVEPGYLSTLNLEVSYYLGEEAEDINADETVVNARGKVAEGMRIEIYPTKSIIKRKKDAFYMPWRFSASLDDNMGVEPDAALGVLKLWCILDIKMRNKFGRLSTKPYTQPSIAWTNDFFPYYVPFYLIKAVRGIKPVLWRDTAQYKKFMGDILRHVDIQVTKVADHLPLMQTLSKDDIKSINGITVGCHSYKGGTCTCGNKVDKYLASVLVNNNGKCLDHGAKYDNVSQQVFTGHIKTVEGVYDIVF